MHGDEGSIARACKDQLMLSGISNGITCITIAGSLWAVCVCMYVCMYVSCN